MNDEFDKIINRYGTNSAKWDEADELYGKGLIHLGVADMDFKSPEPILNTMQKVLNHGVFGYTVFNDNYYKTVQQWMKRRFDWEIDKEWIVFCPRIIIAVSLIVQAFTKEGEGVIVQSPLYAPLKEAVEKNNRNLIINPLKLENGKYTMDFDDLERKIDSSVKILILCSPSNPVGRVWTIEELKRLSEICEKHNLIVISDEIHSDIIYDGYKHTPLAAVSKAIQKRAIICNSVTKTFNVPGIIISNIIIPNEEIREIVRKSIDTIGMHNPNIFSVPVVEAAYTECDQWVEDVMEYIEGNYSYVDFYLRKNMPKLKVIKPEGTYLLWIDCREMGMNEVELTDWFMNKAKVGVYLGSCFGEEGKGFIRINIATSRENIKLALERIRKYYPIN